MRFGTLQSRSAVSLVWYVRGISPPSTNILGNTVRHNFPHIVNKTPQLLFVREINGIFPQTTILQSAPIPPVILAAFGGVYYLRIASSLRLERRRSNAPSLKTVLASCYRFCCFIGSIFVIIIFRGYRTTP